jgi:hypothetical protein
MTTHFKEVAIVDFKSVKEWREYVIKHWGVLKKGADSLPLATAYERLIAIALLPTMPHDATTLRSLLRNLNTMRHGKPIRERFKSIYADMVFDRTIESLILMVLDAVSVSLTERESLDWMLVTTGALAGVKNVGTEAQTFAKAIIEDLHQKHPTTSAIRVQAGIISAGQSVVFAGQDVNIVSHYYQGDKTHLKSYLTLVRSEWNIPISNILPGFTHQNENALRLHNLYTPIDAWTDDSYEAEKIEQLTQRRFRAIEQDMNESRQSIQEAIAIHPLIVITGGPGTGKSSLCRFIATCLAYACDPSAEKDEGVNGLDLLGSAWIHGAILPIYVSLRDFCADKLVFPSQPEQGKSQCLLDYIRKTTDTFAPELERYLLNEDVPTHGALLILDGLDEVYRENDRLVLQRIIENWADRFPKCRIMVTSRTYAYRNDARWRLSKRFASAELAPFTWKQMQHYIESWYSQAAFTRPSNFGGRTVAQSHTQSMAKDLMKTIISTPSLWPLARQPLMLALLTLIHEDNKRLPSKKADLYEKTVELLDRWNIPMPTDNLAEKLTNLNLEQMHAALKLIAFELQKRQIQYHKFPSTVERKDLLEQFMKQQKQGDGLGASIEDVLEYLATRNGILVSDKYDSYRFPHLSIQEYLAACSLIELYDECLMPDTLKSESSEGWVFPTNIAQLIKHDPFRWRNVALFAGSIIANGVGQDSRWSLIEELLPEEVNASIDDNILQCICVASEIWSESWLKARTRTQKIVHTHLISCLKAIQYDERLDAPERAQILNTLGRLETDL